MLQVVRFTSVHGLDGFCKAFRRACINFERVSCSCSRHDWCPSTSVKLRMEARRTLENDSVSSGVETDRCVTNRFWSATRSITSVHLVFSSSDNFSATFFIWSTVKYANSRAWNSIFRRNCSYSSAGPSTMKRRDAWVGVKESWAYVEVHSISHSFYVSILVWHGQVHRAALGIDDWSCKTKRSRWMRHFVSRFYLADGSGRFLPDWICWIFCRSVSTSVWRYSIRSSAALSLLELPEWNVLKTRYKPIIHMEMKTM